MARAVVYSNPERRPAFEPLWKAPVVLREARASR